MKINITNKIFFNLLKLAGIGEWVVNSYSDDEESDQEASDSLGFLFEKAKDYGLENLVIVNEEDKTISPSQEYEDIIFPIIDRYDDINFIDKLAMNLGSRDFIEEFGRDKIDKMDEQEIIEKSGKYIESYKLEFLTNGIKGLRLQR